MLPVFSLQAVIQHVAPTPLLKGTRPLQTMGTEMLQRGIHER